MTVILNTYYIDRDIKNDYISMVKTLITLTVIKNTYLYDSDPNTDNTDSLKSLITLTMVKVIKVTVVKVTDYIDSGPSH